VSEAGRSAYSHRIAKRKPKEKIATATFQRDQAVSASVPAIPGIEHNAAMRRRRPRTLTSSEAFA